MGAFVGAVVGAGVPSYVVWVIVGVVVLVVLLGLLKLLWKVAEPDEAMIISGLAARGGPELAEGAGFKIVVGKGSVVLRGFQSVRFLSLAAHKSDLVVNCVTIQGIEVHVRGVVVYKVGDDPSSIANAARRFLDREDEMDKNVHEVFAGHLRSIVGSMTVEQIIREREKLSGETRNSSATEMQRLGLVIDSLQIQEVQDPSGYIDNLARPHKAAVETAARIAEAERNREATEREQQAAAAAAKAVSDSEIEQAKVKAAADQEKARAAQAGPLSEAQSRQEVVVQETRVAELEAQRKEMQLQTEIVKPAQADRDARIAAAEAAKQETELNAQAQSAKVRIEADAAAAAQVATAEADAKAQVARANASAEATRATGLAEADATRARGEAEGEAIRAKGVAEADAIQKRAEALEHNNEAVIGQQIAGQLPEIVRAAGEAFKSIDNLTVLNGGEGMGQLVQQVMGIGASAVPMFQGLLGSRNGGDAGKADGGPGDGGAKPDNPR